MRGAPPPPRPRETEAPGHGSHTSSFTAGCGSSSALERVSLHAGLAGRNGEPQDVAQRAGPPIGNGAAEFGHRGPDDGLGGDDLAQGASLPRCPTPDEVEHERVDQPAGKAHLDSAAHATSSRSSAGHDVVEGPVQVRERRVNDDASDHGRRLSRHGQLAGRAVADSP